MPTNPPHATARLTLLPPDKGGRLSPLAAGYRSILHFIEGSRDFGVQVDPDAGLIDPGQEREVGLSFWATRELPTICSGDRFELREGTRVVGHGTFTSARERDPIWAGRADLQDGRGIINADAVVEGLRELASKEEQRELWLATGGPRVGSFVESVASVYDDSVLSDVLRRPDAGELLGVELVAAFEGLSQTLRAVQTRQPVDDLIESSEMALVRSAAARALELVQEQRD